MVVSMSVDGDATCAHRGAESPRENRAAPAWPRVDCAHDRVPTVACSARRACWAGSFSRWRGGRASALRRTRLGTPAARAAAAVLAARSTPSSRRWRRAWCPATAPAAAWPTRRGRRLRRQGRRAAGPGPPRRRAQSSGSCCGLFENGLTGLLAVRVGAAPFTALVPADQDARLEAWRHSRLALLRTGYQALVRLATRPTTPRPRSTPWSAIPGPPEVPA